MADYQSVEIDVNNGTFPENWKTFRVGKKDTRPGRDSKVTKITKDGNSALIRVESGHNFSTPHCRNFKK